MFSDGTPLEPFFHRTLEMETDKPKRPDIFPVLHEKSTPEEIAKSRESVLSDSVLSTTLDFLPEVMLILNANRQIIHANLALLEKLGLDSCDSICGLRPGALLDCGHANDAPEGCGASPFCRECGAFNAIVESQASSTKCVRECRLSLKEYGEAMDLRVTATPFEISGEKLTMLVVHDISDEKRRHILERIFFHDIMNLAGGIQGSSELLLETASQDLKPLAEMISSASSQLVEEINAQRELLIAERGELKLTIEKMDSYLILEELISIYSKHEVSGWKHIALDKKSARVEFFSSRALLVRVLSNMLKNALEATPRGGEVALSSSILQVSNEIEFRVNNQLYIPKCVQLQIFQRSFSTKGEGRGLGTYSIKLLTEKYLHGKVGFSSDEVNGTCFFVRLKLSN